jgi:hypothetical protein
MVKRVSLDSCRTAAFDRVAGWGEGRACRAAGSARGEKPAWRPRPQDQAAGPLQVLERMGSVGHLWYALARNPRAGGIVLVLLALSLGHVSGRVRVWREARRYPRHPIVARYVRKPRIIKIKSRA